MQKYIDKDGDSGVESFEIHETFITIKFKGTTRTYTYSYQSAGQSHIEKMKRLAVSGDGLNAYINNYVKSKFVH